MSDQDNQNIETNPGKQEWQTPVLIALDRGPAAGDVQQPNEGAKNDPNAPESGTPGTGIGRGPLITGPS